jgi:hypothetical protein
MIFYLSVSFLSNKFLKTYFRNMLHASGKFVPVIVANIAPAITEEQKAVLTSCQVIAVVKTRALNVGFERCF